MKLETTEFRFTVERPRVVDVVRLFEAYEGMCLVRTENPRIAELQFLVAPGQVEDFLEVVDAVAEDLGLTPLPAEEWS